MILYNYFYLVHLFLDKIDSNYISIDIYITNKDDTNYCN